MKRIALLSLALALAAGCHDRSGAEQTESKARIGQTLAGAPAGAAKSEEKAEEMKDDGPEEPEEEFNTEEYDHIVENPFLETMKNPVSTFSVDVDTASYSNVRRFLNQGTLPPPDAVRIEELINYFVYDYPKPEGEHPFSVTTELGPAPWRPEHRLLRIGLQGRRLATEDLPMANLIFLLDVSGSMDMPDKLPLLKAAFKLLVDQMRPEDRVAIVVYAGAAGLVLPSTPGTDKSKILDALLGLQAGGSTAGAQGIQLAYQIAKENFIEGGNNRVILATDGDFNVGPSSQGELVRLIEEQRKAGVFLTVLGFGSGNIKDSRMEQLANKGNGNYAYIDGILEARKVMVTELGGTLLTIAKDVKIQVEFNPVKVKSYRLIGYENRLLRREDFDDDTKDAGELGAGHRVTALYELEPQTETAAALKDESRYTKTTLKPDTSGELAVVRLRYKKPDESKSRLIVKELEDRKVGMDKVSDDLRFAAAVTQFGMLLRKSKHLGTANWDNTTALAKGAIGPDLNGYRKAFLVMLDKAKKLSTR